MLGLFPYMALDFLLREFGPKSSNMDARSARAGDMVVAAAVG